MTINGTMLFFVIVAAVAILLQTLILFGLAKGIKEFVTRLEALLGRVENQASPIMATTRDIIDDAQPKIADITTNLAESAATVKVHVTDLAQATGEIVERARLQAARIDELVENTIEKIEVTTDLVQTSVVTPVRRIHALISAVSAGLGFLRANRARRKSEGNSSEADEEMFI